MHRLRKNKGVSAVIGVILLVSIVMTSISVVLIIWVPHMEETKVNSQRSSVYSQLNILDDTLKGEIDKGEGATEKSQIAIESGSLSTTPYNDKLIVVYSDTDKYTVSRLGDYDKNFTLMGNASWAKIYWPGTKTPYSRFSPSGVPPIVEEGPSGYFYECSVYNFTDYTNNMANYTDHGELVPLPPSHVNYTDGDYTDEQYSNISADDDANNMWEGSNDNYVNIYYKFKINENPSAIAWINFTWVGYDNLIWGGYFSIYIWNISSTAWEILYQTGVSASQKQTFSFNITSPDFSANYINNSYIIFGVSGGKGLSPVSPIITVTSPNGGETWVRGSTYPITWSSSSSSSITVISPNGGETWVRGSTHTITWSSSNAGSNVKIELYKGGSFDSTIISSTTNDGSYSWAIPPGQATGSDYKIEITSIDYPTVYDDSDNYFTITDEPTETIEGLTCEDTCRACCFPAGTKVTMADRLYKNIEDIVVGDEVLSYDVEKQKTITSGVSNVITIIREGVHKINNGVISPTDDHPLYVRKSDGRTGWAAINPNKSGAMYDDRNAMPLQIGDKLLTHDGKWITIKSIEFKPGVIKTYTFTVDSRHHNYFANGFLVSNAEECLVCFSPPANNNDYNNRNDLTDFIDDNSIMFSGTVGSNVKIELYKGGSFDSTIISSTANDGSYSWAIPPGQATGSDYKIEITSIDYPTVYDYSDNDFAIIESGGPTSEVTCPYTCDDYTCSGPTCDSTCDTCETECGQDTCDYTCPATCCFLAGTKISIADGSCKNIEDVKVGDLVKSFDEKNQRITDSKVIKVFCHSYEEMGEYHLVINDDIRVTPNHPFYVNKEWLPAGDIKVGDLLLSMNGDNVEVISIQKIFEKYPTYNLEVEGYHNYFAEKILVHNKLITACGDTCPSPTCDGTCSGQPTCDDSPTGCGYSTCDGSATCDYSDTCYMAPTCYPWLTCPKPTCGPAWTCSWGITCAATWCAGGTCVGASTCSGSTCEGTCPDDYTCACFLAGTKITMANGSYKNIEDVCVDDIVKTFDETSNEIVQGKVTEVFHHTSEEMREYYLLINNIFGVTPDHLMYVNNNWLPAGDIKIGDALFDISGNAVTITSIEQVFKKVPTFNLEIEQHHKYFANNILVHNGKVCVSPPANGYPDPGDFNDFLDDNSIMFSGNSLFGVMPTYVPGSSDSPLFSLKTAKGIDETPIVWDINYLGINYDSFENTDNNIDSSCCGTPSIDGSCCEIAVEDDIALTLYEYYVEVDVFYGANDNIRPWTNITTGPAHNEEITYNNVIFEWEGHDDLTASEDLVYKYRLDPYETSWQPEQDYWTSDTSVTYNLPRGNYEFHVRAMDKAHNIETIENVATNTRAFKIIVPNQILDHTNSSFPITAADGPTTFTAKYPLTDFVLIELYDDSYSTIESSCNILIFDFTAVEYVLPSSFGTYGFSVVNGAIVSYDRGTVSLRKRPIEFIYDTEDTFMCYVIQTPMSETSPASSFSGSGSCQLSSRLVENRILDDADVSSMLQFQIFGKNQDAWIDYFITSLNCVTTSDENILNYNGPSEKLILGHSIIEMSFSII